MVQLSLMNKKVIIGIAAVLLIAVSSGVYVLSSQNSKPQQVTQEPQIEEEIVETISSNKLGLTMFLRNDKKAVKFEMKNPGDISLVEYQISYTKEINGEQVPEGLIGEVKVSPADEEISVNYREFGTCSRNVCRYDNVVSAVKLTLKITKTDGKVLAAEDSISL